MTKSEQYLVALLVPFITVIPIFCILFGLDTTSWTNGIKFAYCLFHTATALVPVMIIYLGE